MRQSEREKRLKTLEAERPRGVGIPALDVWWCLVERVAAYSPGRWEVVARQATTRLAGLGYAFDAAALVARCEDLNRRRIGPAALVADLDDTDVLLSAETLLYGLQATCYGPVVQFDGPGQLRGSEPFTALIARFNALCAGELYIPIGPEEARVGAAQLRAGELMLGWDKEIYVSAVKRPEDTTCVSAVCAAYRALAQQTGERFQTTSEIADWLDACADVMLAEGGD